MRVHLSVGALLALALIPVMQLRAQTPMENAIQQLTSQLVTGYVQPFADGAGGNFNSGLYRSANLGEDGLHIQLQIVTSGTLIGEREKTYYATPPSGYPQTPVETATIFGGQGTVVQGPAPGLSYQFQNGQLKTPILPFAVPQLTLGTFYGTQAVVRYVPIPRIGDIPRITLAGGGIRHNFSRYLPGSPVDLTAGVFYQRLSIGDIMHASGFLTGLQAGKTFSMVSLYGGVQYQTSTLSLDYLYQGPGSTPNTRIRLDLQGRNTFSGTVGIDLNLMVLDLSADATFGRVTILTLALGFGV